MLHSASIFLLNQLLFESYSIHQIMLHLCPSMYQTSSHVLLLLLPQVQFPNAQPPAKVPMTFEMLVLMLILPVPRALRRLLPC